MISQKIEHPREVNEGVRLLAIFGFFDRLPKLADRGHAPLFSFNILDYLSCSVAIFFTSILGDSETFEEECEQ